MDQYYYYSLVLVLLTIQLLFVKNAYHQGIESNSDFSDEDYDDLNKGNFLNNSKISLRPEVTENKLE